MEKTCVKCGHTNRVATGLESEECPHCGVIYAKAKPRPAASAQATGFAATRPQALERGAPPLAAGVNAQEAQQSPVKAKRPSALGTYFWIVVAAVAVIWYHSHDSGPATMAPSTAGRLDQIHAKVAQDAVREFEIAEKHGTAIDRCVQAGAVTAAFLQAKNETAYADWKRIEVLACDQAGVRR